MQYKIYRSLNGYQVQYKDDSISENKWRFFMEASVNSALKSFTEYRTKDEAIRACEVHNRIHGREQVLAFELLPGGRYEGN